MDPPLVHLLCTGGGERGREEDTCERTCEGHECMRQTHTIQVLYYINTNSLALTFHHIHVIRTCFASVSASSETCHLNCRLSSSDTPTFNGRSPVDFQMYIMFASNE